MISIANMAMPSLLLTLFVMASCSTAPEHAVTAAKSAPTLGTWTERAPLPTARDHLAVVAANGRIHAIGGRVNSPTQNVDNHNIYNPATNTWTAGAPLPTARSGVAYALYQNFIVVAGGECRDKRTFTENEAYDLKAGRWVILAPLPTARHAFRGVAVGQTLYFAGGAPNCGGGPRLSELLVFSWQ